MMMVSPMQFAAGRSAIVAGSVVFGAIVTVVKHCRHHQHHG